METVTTIRSFNEPGMMASALLHLLGMNLSIIQLNRGKFEGYFRLTKIDEISFLQVAFNQKVHIQGAKSTREQILFALNFKSSLSNLLAHGTELQTDCLFGFDPMRDIHLVIPSCSRIKVVMVPKIKFFRLAQQLGRDELNENWLRRNWIQLRPKVWRNLMGYLHQLFDLIESQSNFLTRSSTSPLVNLDLLPLIVDAVSRPPSEIYGDLPFYQRIQLVKQAQEFMRDSLQQPLTLSHLYNALGISKRTLIYGFKDIFGMGPMTYVKIQRLNAIRHELLLAEPEIHTVSDIAHSYGFWSLGHFSRDYKQMFAELPSKTLLNQVDNACRNIER